MNTDSETPKFDFTAFREDSYNMYLATFLRKNKGSEVNFIEENIAGCNYYIELYNNKLNLEKDALYKEFEIEKKSYCNYNSYDESAHLIQFTRVWISSTNENLSLVKRNLEWYKIKLGRFQIHHPEAESEIDLINSNAVQKIIYLQELGIIDLLRKEHCFATSVNNLAKVITAITGEKITTIQPYLNVLINKTGNDNNDPYKTTSTVSKVKNHLINVGFKLK